MDEQELLKSYESLRDRFIALDKQRKEDIHALVSLLYLILPATYMDLLKDMGVPEYLEIYAIQELINREKIYE